MPSITGVVIAFNEQEHIQQCVESLSQVCDEVIVVDSHSQDDTPALARQAGALVLDNDWLGDGPQRSYGAKRARNDWILSLDADERLEEDTVAFIKAQSLDEPSVAYSFRRRNLVGKRWIKAAGFYPDLVTRLYNRTHSDFNDKKTHANLIAARTINSNTHLRHFTYQGLNDWITRINTLSSEDALSMHARGKTASRFSPGFHALNSLVRKLVFKGGFFQGLDGMNVAVTTAFHAYMKYLKLYEMGVKEKGEQSQWEGKR